MSSLMYFAYGSNLNQRDLARWCRNQGLEYPLGEPWGRAIFPDVEYAFNYFSPPRRGGALNLMARRGQVVEGMLYPVLPGGWKTLDIKEGAPERYEKKEVVVLDGQGDWRRAITYLVTDQCRLDQPVEPATGYVECVLEGMKHHRLGGHEVLQVAAEGRGDALRLEEVFIYGTLLPGEYNHHHLAGHTWELVSPSRARGRLFHLGRYPGMRPSPGEGDHQVQGVLVRVEDLDEVLVTLDGLEDFVGYHRIEESMYVRTVVEVEREGKEKSRAWTYFLREEPHPAQVIVGGDWRNRPR